MVKNVTEQQSALGLSKVMQSKDVSLWAWRSVPRDIDP